MKRLSIRIVIAVLTFVIGVGITVAWLLLHSGQEQNSQASSVASSTLPEIPTVDYCDLVQNPKLYEQKTVRLRVTYKWGREWAYFYDAKCAGKTGKERSYRVGLAWVEISDSFESCSNPEYMKDVEITRQYEEAEITVVGRLTGTGGCGHLGGYPFEFTVDCIEEFKYTKAKSY